MGTIFNNLLKQSLPLTLHKYGNDFKVQVMTQQLNEYSLLLAHICCNLVCMSIFCSKMSCGCNFLTGSTADLQFLRLEPYMHRFTYRLALKEVSLRMDTIFNMYGQCRLQGTETLLLWIWFIPTGTWYQSEHVLIKILLWTYLMAELGDLSYKPMNNLMIFIKCGHVYEELKIKMTIISN